MFQGRIIAWALAAFVAGFFSRGICSTALAQGAAKQDEVLIFAAASLKDALDGVIAEWRRETGKSARASYAASSALAKQIEQDAPARIFISADLAWMDYVEARKLIRPESRFNLLGNRLVLIAPKDSKIKIDLKPGTDLARTLGGGLLAMANVDAVPAGKYGKAALEKLGAWAGVSSKISQAENVRAALLLVSRGEAPLGIVYQTDAKADPNVKIVAIFPEDSHPPIVYPIALTTKAGESAMEFLRFVKSGAAKKYFIEQGFSLLQ